MVTFDTTQRTFDEDCWTWDGYDGCVIHGGGPTGIPEQQIISDVKLLQQRRDDEDIIEFIQLMASKLWDH